MAKASKVFKPPWGGGKSKCTRDREADQRRRAKKPWRNWYKLKEWLSIRARRLSVEPLCRFCKERGDVVPAMVCDHIVPHRGNRTLFFSFENTQSLCQSCHSRDKQREEAREPSPLPNPPKLSEDDLISF